MRIDINLIEKEEKRTAPLLVMLLLVAVGVLLAFLLIFFQTSAEKGKIAEDARKLAETRNLVAEEEERISAYEANDSVSILKGAIAWAESEPVAIVPVMELFIHTLPERGFFKEMTYTYDGHVTLSVQFDTSRESAFYLHELLSSDWVQDAKLLSVESERVEEEEEEEEEGAKAAQEDILPRYVASYDVELDKEAIKADPEEDAEEEGGEQR